MCIAFETLKSFELKPRKQLSSLTKIKRISSFQNRLKTVEDLRINRGTVSFFIYLKFKRWAQMVALSTLYITKLLKIGKLG